MMRYFTSHLSLSRQKTCSVKTDTHLKPQAPFLKYKVIITNIGNDIYLTTEEAKSLKAASDSLLSELLYAVPTQHDTVPKKQSRRNQSHDAYLRNQLSYQISTHKTRSHLIQNMHNSLSEFHSLPPPPPTDLSYCSCRSSSSSRPSSSSSSSRSCRCCRRLHDPRRYRGQSGRHDQNTGIPDPASGPSNLRRHPTQLPFRAQPEVPELPPD